VNAGTRGIVLKTTDGGDTWMPQTSGTTAALTSVYFIDAKHGWAVGAKNNDPRLSGCILRTVDGGTTWSQELIDKHRRFHDVCFVNPSTGWVVGDGTIRKTTDGGLTWQEQSSNPGNSAFLSSVCFLDAEIGWVSNGNGVVLKTTDGGSTWTRTRLDAIWLSSVFFVDARHGWAVGGVPQQADPTILASSDGGATWHDEHVALPNLILNAVFGVSQGSVWAGAILRASW
jgi:photosystem II stability/assembly factor-like uncharacterized protein